MGFFSPEQRFIVTGATSGIGEGVALLLNAQGATVIGIGRSSDSFDVIKEKALFPEHFFFEKKDLAEDTNTLTAYVKELKDKYGKFQGMAYCAGIGQVKPVRAIEAVELRQTMEVNFFAPYMMAKAFADKRNHNGKGAACVFVSSVAGKTADKGQSAYASSKAALVAAVRSIARESATQGIRMNCVSPSAIKTPMLLLTDPQALAEQEKHYPMGMGEVADVANMVVFLLSEQAKWITAQDYVIDCGAFL